MENLKTITFLIILIMSQSCTTESLPTNPDPALEVSSSENKTAELINYTYKDQKFTVQYQKEKNGDELVPIEDESYELLNQITDQNETLITYVVDKNNYILFNADVDLNNFLQVSYINKNSYVSKTLVSSPYDDPNSLRIFDNSNFYIPTEIRWNGPSSVNGSNVGCYFVVNSTNESRLKNFANTPFWKLYTNIPYKCSFDNEFIGNNPNDKVSSIRVSGCYARCYEDANYGGRSFVIDARGTTLQIHNLKDLRRASWGRNWNDNISSIQLSY